jgi:NADPH2:quinone reductase
MKVLASVNELSDMLAEGKLEVQFDTAFDLEDAAEAHEYVESRQSMGKVVLTP